ncbi:MAG TPA: endonuclease Q family protein [Candidatus Nanoarchaeia archaeon]|nr:endonuclease Q family protein [Candidatus Nanoarchaeia archaeon]
MVEIIADLQIHSRYARATSKNITIDNLEKYARIKGITLLGTGDFQHPEWREEINAKLKEDDKGILRTESGFCFLWQTEISLMFSQNGKGRAVHLLVFSPNMETSDKITSYLGSKGRLDYDGRPIFGITCRNFVHDLKQIDDRIEIIPAHCMTPWFGIFGSKSGFNSLEECFLDMRDKIYAVESGMSADPAMLWRFKEISEGKVNVVSFSDAHSFWPWRLGRECTIFELKELSYDAVMKAIRTGIGLKATIETPPAYGKYHYDGHRNCDFSSSPEETKKLNGICPKCNKPLVIGVDYRVEEIAKHEKGFRPKNARPFHNLIPLSELISFHLKSPLESKRTWEIYNVLINLFENELNILLNVPPGKFLEKNVDDKLVDLIMMNRESKIYVRPGFDGEYGKIMINEKQKKLI